MTDEEKQALNRAFGTLRRHGFVARQAFSCCNGCGSYELGTYVRALPDGRRAKVRGTVFYSRQARLEDGVYLQFQGAGLTPAAEAGLAAAFAAQAEGLHVEWDGSEERCVRVVFEDGLRRIVERVTSS